MPYLPGIDIAQPHQLMFLPHHPRSIALPWGQTASRATLRSRNLKAESDFNPTAKHSLQCQASRSFSPKTHDNIQLIKDNLKRDKLHRSTILFWDKLFSFGTFHHSRNDDFRLKPYRIGGRTVEKPRNRPIANFPCERRLNRQWLS